MLVAMGLTTEAAAPVVVEEEEEEEDAGLEVGRDGALRVFEVVAGDAVGCAC